MAQPTSSGREGWIDMSRALSVIGVALFHTTEWIYLPALGPQMESSAGRLWVTSDVLLGHIRLPLLLLLSGMLAAGKVREGLGWLKTRVWIITNAYLYLVWAFSLFMIIRDFLHV